MTHIKFIAPPTGASFMKSDAFFRIIAGPIGSAKTTTCIFELFRRSLEQRPGPDGLRHTRFAVVRQTLKQLKDTVLKDILTWLQGVATYKVSENTIHVSYGDMRSEWMLIPLDDPDDQRRLLSMQLTGAWLNEIIEMSPEIVSPILGRCGRYPSTAQGGPSWYGAIADTNMPTEGDAWHNLMDIKTPPDWAVFIQPGGLEPDAENLENLPGQREYYIRAARSHTPEWVTRYVHAQYGPDPSGSAVFKDTFKREFHTVKLTPKDLVENRQFAIEPSHGMPLVVVQDFGRNPCALICQVDHRGRGLVLEEIISQDMGLELHIDQNLRPALNRPRFFGKDFYVIGDPAGRQRNTSYEETSFDLLKNKGLRAFPAPTNDIQKRLRAVDSLLLQQRDGGPALLIDADQCPTLVLALHSRYRFAKRRNGQLNALPEKLHPWSDVADDLEYFCLVVQGGFTDYVANRLRRDTRPVTQAPRRRFSAAAWT